MKKILGVVVFNVVLIVVLLEIVLRLFAPRLSGQIGIASRYVTTGNPYSEAWTPAWQQNRDHYWAMKPGLVYALQYGSATVSFHLTTHELWAGGGIGFRTKPVDFFVDTVVVGDSFGLCFTEQVDCWVDKLAQQTQTGIVNLSQPVTGTTSHYRILRDFGAPLTPPLVLWQFFGNDFNDDYGLAVFRDELKSLEDDTTSTTNSAGIVDWLRHNSAFFAVAETVLTGRYQGVPDSERLFDKPYTVQFGTNNENTLMFGGLYEQQALDMVREQNQLGLNLSIQAFTDAQALVKTWGGRLVVIIMPTREEVYSDLTAPIMGQANLDKLTSARTTMHALCDQLALTCYDPFDVFREHAQKGEALYHVDDMHLNPLGNQILADWLMGLGL